MENIKVITVLQTLSCVILASGSLDALHFDTFDTPSRTCEPISVDMCKDQLGYNNTGGPNFLNEEAFTQQDSSMLLKTFEPLINNGCSKQLKRFLCTAYVPMCDPQVKNLIGPCRSVCENVKRRCQPVLQKVGLPWPSALNCSVFVANNTGSSMCMEFPPEGGNTLAPPTYRPKPTKNADTESTSLEPSQCSYMRNPLAYKFINATQSCHPLCTVDNIFNQKEKQFAEIWMAVWTSFCLLFSVMTVITFFIDTSKFHYPKRPIIFLSLCYAMYSIAYLIRLIAGRQQVTCDTDGLMIQGLDNTNCAAIFLLLYYFSTAAALWWVILSLTWLLSAGLKWSHDAIELYSSYFHLVSWGIPAVQSIIIIVLRDVSGDELTGLCFVGTNNANSLLGYVIGPLGAYLLLGIALLVAGYIILFCQEKKEATKGDEKIEILMVRIGIFSLLYTVPATCLLACYFYEYLNLSSWTNGSSTNSPSIEIYILKTFSGLLPGITSGLCVLGCRTLDTWANACSNLCFKKYNRNSKAASYQSNNNNNTVRQYIPVKAVRQSSTNTSSHHSSSRLPPTTTHSSRSYHKHHRSHNHNGTYLLSPSPVCGPSNRYPGEYHV